MDLSIIPKFGVIGSPIHHSVSPAIYRLFSGQTGVILQYEAIELDRHLSVEGLIDFLHDFQASGGRGLNVTSPFKKIAFQAMDQLGEGAAVSGSVNTIILREGLFQGENTDLLGWAVDCQRLGWVLKGKKIAILGAGGAVRGILGALAAESPAEIIVINRTLGHAEVIATEWQARFPAIRWRARAWRGAAEVVDGLINATARSVKFSEFELTNLQTKDAFCYDLNYNRSASTPFLDFSKSHGALKTVDGIGMLWAQAAYSFLLWHGVLPRWQELLDESV